MRSLQIGKHFLQVKLMLVHVGGIGILAAALCLTGAITWLWSIPHAKHFARGQQTEIYNQKLSLQMPPPAPKLEPLSPAQSNLLAFYSTLGTRQSATDQIRLLFNHAREAGIALEKGEYKSAYSPTSRSYSYQVLLPVTGNYGAIRRFCEKVLVAIPFASLDEITFRRDGIAAGALQAKLRFTLHLGDAPVIAPASAPRLDPALFTMQKVTP